MSSESRAEKRREQRGGNYLKKTTTVGDQQKLLTAYHERLVEPRLQFLEEHVFYKKMWPHQKAYYHWLNLKGWCRARWLAFGKWRYVQRWHKGNDEMRGDLDGEA